MPAGYVCMHMPQKTNENLSTTVLQTSNVRDPTGGS